MKMSDDRDIESICMLMPPLPNALVLVLHDVIRLAAIMRAVFVLSI